MEYYLYILYSSTLDKYYFGYSQNPHQRLEFHNSPLNKIWSKRGQPWVLKRTISFETKTEALKAENHIKKQKNKSYTLNVIETGVLSF
jgi:putative endonuclease